MPFFFLMTGLRTDLTTAGADALVVFAVATVVAVAGKMAGTALPARWPAWDGAMPGRWAHLCRPRG
jgi:Kef-type K+ transport system membrane component KefB